MLHSRREKEMYAEKLKAAIGPQSIYAVSAAWAEMYGRKIDTTRKILYQAAQPDSRILSLREAAELCAVLDLEPGALQPDLRRKSDG